MDLEQPVMSITHHWLSISSGVYQCVLHALALSH